jgi:hypothetical protein
MSAPRPTTGFNLRTPPALFLPKIRGIFGRVRPDHGGRLELKLSEATGATARYVVVIFTPSAEISSSAQLNAETGVVELGAWAKEAPPAWLDALAKTLLRTVLRTKLSAGDWPRRMTRWRPAPVPRGSDPTD